jgi:nitrogen fixation NifU-like protein
MNPYGDTIQEHYRHPRHYGSLEQADIRHEDVNPFCGDRIRIELALSPDRIVSAARFQGDLCMIATAAASLLMERIHSISIDAVERVSEGELLDALAANIQPSRRQCALLPLGVLHQGVKAWREGRTG